jgi:DNA (cytosine-5)-methyltransferase 1
MRMIQNGSSGKIVVNIEPDLKKRLYATLSLSGSTLKDWFRKSAAAYCDEQKQPSLTRTSGYRPAQQKKTPHVREELAQYKTAPAPSNGHKLPLNKYKVVSMFSGCGGMDLGFTGGFEVFGRRYRSLPFEVIWANDLNAEACKTYRRNLGHEILRGDVWDLLDRMPESADVLIGGFPCQDISVNGKRAGVNGARSSLYKAMVAAIKRLKPKVFVAENVKALLRHEEWLRQVVGDFEGLGYKLHYQLYQAADYGVPQTRERVLFVGTADHVQPYIPPIPERSAANWMTAISAIGDLEKIPQNPHINHIWSLANTSPEQGNRKLIQDRPGYTIRAECHGNIQYHYRLPRRISMREAARIQSFPDKFLFVSGLRETERQVGNAVPPILAWHVANSVLSSLRQV